jgi:hypothetical protein
MLTKRAFELLQIMVDSETAPVEDDGYDRTEIICEGAICYLGLDKISYRTVLNLIAHCCISLNSGEESARRFSINGTGRAALADPGVPDRVRLAILAQKPVDHLGNPLEISLNPNS